MASREDFFHKLNMKQNKNNDMEQPPPRATALKQNICLAELNIKRTFWKAQLFLFKI